MSRALVFSDSEEEHALEVMRCDCMLSEDKPALNSHRHGEGVWFTLAGNHYVMKQSDAKRLLAWLKKELEP